MGFATVLQYCPRWAYWSHLKKTVLSRSENTKAIFQRVIPSSLMARKLGRVDPLKKLDVEIDYPIISQGNMRIPSLFCFKNMAKGHVHTKLFFP
jgi:hypothetical protein